MPRKPDKKTQQSQSAPAKAARLDGTRHEGDPRIVKAQVAWQQRRYDDAIRYYEQALARSPRNPVLLVDVARAYALRFRFAEAEKLVELAERLYPDDARLQQMLARSYGMLQQFDRAIRCYARSLELAPETPERAQTLVELAKMHERLHDLDAASRYVEEAARLAPQAAMPQYVRATIDRRAGRTQQAIAAWTKLAADSRTPPGVVAESLYELAALHDGVGDFAQAHDELIRAKQIFNRAAAPYREDAADIARISGKTFATVTSEHFNRWAAAGQRLKPLDGPLALLTSHPRSGTTLLEQVLDSHPQIVSADELQIMTELAYLPLLQKAPAGSAAPQVLDRLSAEDLERVRSDYYCAMEGALREPIAGRLLVDKNPEMTMLLPLVARAFPEMRIVFALRDPRDVVVSSFMQRLPLNAVSVHYLSLESTAKKYATTMRAWLKIRPWIRNSWLEIRYEDAVADLEGQARRVLEFLEMPWDDGVLAYHRRAQRKHVHSPTYEAVTQPVYTRAVGRWRNYAAQLEPCMDVLQPFIEAFGYA